MKGDFKWLWECGDSLPNPCTIKDTTTVYTVKWQGTPIRRLQSQWIRRQYKTHLIVTVLEKNLLK